jgi:hypothetical protein
VPDSNGNYGNNGNNHDSVVLTTPHANVPPIVTTKLSSIAEIVYSLTSSPPALPPAPTTLPSTSSLDSTLNPNGASNNQPSETSSSTGTEPSNNNGTSTTWRVTPLLPTGQVAPDQPHNTSNHISGYTMTLSAGAGAGGNDQLRSVSFYPKKLF